MESIKISSDGVLVTQHHGGSGRRYMSDKILKLQTSNSSLLESSLRSSSIFSGCYILINGLLAHFALEDLRRIIMSHGGICESYPVSRVTHFISNSLTQAQLKKLNSRKSGEPNMKYVTEDWVLDSIKALKRLNESDFVPAGLRSNGSKSTKSLHFPSTVEENCASNAIQKADMYPATEEGFTGQFFRRSRLHFIGSWKSRLPKLIRKLSPSTLMNDHDKAATSSSFPVFTSHENSSSRSASNSCSSVQGVVSCTSGCRSERVVIHIDMDCFFVSALLRSKPHLKTLSVAVAHSGSSAGSSEISSCNYPARQKGVRSGMFMSAAKKLCPDLIVLEYDFELYEELTEKIYGVFFNAGASIVEPVSVDEAYLEYDGNNQEIKEHGQSPDTLSFGLRKASWIRARILQETGCEASAGVGPNMLLAKLATRKAKPNGQFEFTKVTDSKQSTDVLVCDGIFNIPACDLPGVGHVLNRKLKEKNIVLCGDLLKFPLSTLQSWFGHSAGQMLWNYCRGICNRKLATVQPPKSVGTDVNYGLRMTHEFEMERLLKEITQEVSVRLVDAGRKARCFTLKLMKRRANAPEPIKYGGHGICDSVSKSVAVQVSIFSPKMIFDLVWPLCRSLMQGAEVADLRGVGLQATKLVECDFENPSALISSSSTSPIALFAIDTESSLITSPSDNLGNGDDVVSMSGSDDDSDYGSNDLNIFGDMFSPSKRSNMIQITGESSDAASSSSSNVVRCDSDVGSSSSNRSKQAKDSDCFSMSQEAFLLAVPAELRSEVKSQLRSQTLASHRPPATATFSSSPPLAPPLSHLAEAAPGLGGNGDVQLIELDDESSNFSTASPSKIDRTVNAYKKKRPLPIVPHRIKPNNSRSLHKTGHQLAGAALKGRPSGHQVRIEVGLQIQAVDDDIRRNVPIAAMAEYLEDVRNSGNSRGYGDGAGSSTGFVHSSLSREPRSGGPSLFSFVTAGAGIGTTGVLGLGMLSPAKRRREYLGEQESRKNTLTSRGTWEYDYCDDEVQIVHDPRADEMEDGDSLTYSRSSTAHANLQTREYSFSSSTSSSAANEDIRAPAHASVVTEEFSLLRAVITDDGVVDDNCPFISLQDMMACENTLVGMIRVLRCWLLHSSGLDAALAVVDTDGSVGKHPAFLSLSMPSPDEVNELVVFGESFIQSSRLDALVVFIKALRRHVDTLECEFKRVCRHFVASKCVVELNDSLQLKGRYRETSLGDMLGEGWRLAQTEVERCLQNRALNMYGMPLLISE